MVKLQQATEPAGPVSSAKAKEEQMENHPREHRNNLERRPTKFRNMLWVAAGIAAVAAIAAVVLPAPGDDALPAPELADAGTAPTDSVPNNAAPAVPAGGY
jgi:hypothetical protein